ncbi:C45 family peptidase [Virgibacillus sp. 179-BFC.A HS]|uniref:C45 family peptidase n=1 Tax=Tigheibacillus jepli TaxID=3035914 RepID=A0ABU5CFY5_9BACI|nr:C45 family peptidase [Virgibacillus sp. 179-BFC.A HS]MDY0404774.1 C45 family peptidase [Virgibacillus sp. 179-BFC.A HS]
MTDVYSDVVQFRGTHGEFGFFQGKKLLSSPILSYREIQWGPRKERHFIIDPEGFTQIIKSIAPGILEEIHGLAEALKIEMNDAIQLFSGYYLEYVRSGCSVYADKDYMVRNYDSHPRSYEGRYLFYQPTDAGYATIGPSMQITGRIDGMNEKGLVMAYNFTHRKKSADGFLCNMIGRLILETCGNVEEAVDLLKEIPHRHSFSYILLDPAGEPHVVEASPRKVAVRRSSVCTNHFHLLDDENRYRQEDSRRREEIIQREQQYVTNPYQAFQVMNNPAYDVYSDKYDAAAGTLHTSVYFPKEMQAWYAIGPDRPPVIFDFQKWLEGKDTPVSRVRGKIDYPEGFANMA